MKRQSSRRKFLKSTALTGAGVWVGTSTDLLSQSPNEKLNIGVVGCGGKGSSDTDGCASENIVALCDVDEARAGGTIKKYPNAKFYVDYREMLEKEKTLDGVVVSTPDHHHAPASLMAMRLGKGVYCQKPLTHSVYEARLMRDVAREYKVATQMGNQGTSLKGLREAVEVIQSGAIGPVRQVHVWTNRPIWPQGIDRPAAQAVRPKLNWDLWLGPAPWTPYNDAYCPFKWRGWWDYGTGALGDMACHTANMAFMALKLGYPTRIEGESSGVHAHSAPKRSKIVFDFPARGDMPPVKFYWYDGGELPPTELTGGLKLSSSGSLLVGDKGKLYSPNDYGATYKLLPESDFEGYKPPEKWLPRSPGHYREWLDALKGGKPAMSNFDYAAALTEVILLGNVALRVGKAIDWDGPNMKATNCEAEAAPFVKREYRRRWSV